MGNSEVGHLNLGAGRVVPQDLVRISQSIQSGEFYQLPPLVELCAGVRQTGRHASPGGTAGPRRRARARPAPPRLRRAGRAAPGAGDRHPRLPRRPRLRPHPRRRGGAHAAARHAADRRQPGGHRLAHRPLLRHGPRPPVGPHQAGLRRDGPRGRHPGRASGAGGPGAPTSGARPTSSSGRWCTTGDGVPVATMRDGDGVLFFNYRSDRMRQIVSALAIDGFDGFDTGRRPDLACVTMTQYDQTFPLPQAFPAVQPRAHPGRGARRPRPEPVPHRRDREVSPRHLLLQRRVRATVPRRRSAVSSPRNGSRPTTWRRR